MQIKIIKTEGNEIEMPLELLARKLNNIVVDKMADGVLGKREVRWDDTDFINCMNDTVDIMFDEKDFKINMELATHPNTGTPRGIETLQKLLLNAASKLTQIVFNYLKNMGSKEPKEIHNFLTKKHSSVYEDILEGKMSRVKDWFENRDGIGYDTNTKKLFAEEDKIIKEPELLKAYKTPEKYREGEFKVYLRKDDNLKWYMK